VPDGFRRARVIAFYLPQFHPIPENDAWWGPGFTEWRNVARARPLFRGHYQPHIPADLGFYDLRVPETRLAQAEMAAAYGVEAFCYWHYWFAARRLLERPLEEVVKTGEPAFPFCLGWANQSWTGVWHGAEDRILVAQTYPGREDYVRHFWTLFGAFTDPRYVTVDGKPLFYVYCPELLPDPIEFTDLWRQLAVEAGLQGLYLVGEHVSPWDPGVRGFDAAVDTSLLPLREKPPVRRPWSRLRWEWKELRGRPTVYRYADVWDVLVSDARTRLPRRHVPLLPNWDNTPRSGARGLVLHGSTPELFRRQVRRALEATARQAPEHRLVFLKSWNEWAEGNYMEPDLRFGRGYLEVLREEIFVGVPGQSQEPLQSDRSLGTGTSWRSGR
jgi:Glycosyltransferase WbsX